MKKSYSILLCFVFAVMTSFAQNPSRFITQDGHTGGKNTEINFTTGK